MKILRRIGHTMGQAWLTLTARSSRDYWESRYRIGMNSGAGSRGELAQFKAEVLNRFVSEHAIQTVIELGCGDGHQLSLANYPSYLGLDIVKPAIDLCSRRFADDPSKSFLWYDENDAAILARFLSAELALSLDVVYHLVEEDVFRRYLSFLFGIGRRWVIVYSSNCENPSPLPHVRHRQFVDVVRESFPEFELLQTVENRYREQTFAEFYVFRRAGKSSMRA